MTERKDKIVRNKLRDALSVTEAEENFEGSKERPSSSKAPTDIIKWTSDNNSEDSNDNKATSEAVAKPFAAINIERLDSRGSKQQDGESDSHMKFYPRVRTSQKLSENDGDEDHAKA